MCVPFESKGVMLNMRNKRLDVLLPAFERTSPAAVSDAIQILDTPNTLIVYVVL